MVSPPIKYGILGCARIARKVSRAIALSPNAALYAVGSRSLEKAAQFAKDNGFPESAKVYGSYDAVLDDPDVDAVYIPLPTSLHIKWAVAAARKKKHVLLEKPVALNVGELDVILEACESSGVQFMDGTMWMHHPRTETMKEFLMDSTLFGELKSVHSCFTFPAGKDFLENDIRVQPDLDPLGALGDTGWYNIRSILWAANFELPQTVLASPDAILNSAGIILSCTATLQWADGKSATFRSSFLEEFNTDLTIVGTNSTLSLHDFVVPFDENKAPFSTVVGSGPETKHSVTTELPQDAIMIKELSGIVQRIKFEGGEPEEKWPMLSRQTQVVLDAVKLSVDKGYEIVQVIG